MDAESKEEHGQDRSRPRLFGSVRRLVARHNLLSGFEREAVGHGEIRTFFASTVAAALIVWDVAFDLGAFHHVFFEKRQ